MAEPTTIVTGLTWVAAQIAISALGSAGAQTSGDLLRIYKERIAGLQDKPASHDIAKAVRIAQIRALEHVIEDYRSIGRPEWDAEPHTRPEMFFDESSKFCGQAIGRDFSLKVKLNLEVSAPLVAAVDGMFAKALRDTPSGKQANAVASLAERAVLDELRDSLNGVVLPPGFEEHFRQGNQGKARYLELFDRFVNEQMKSNEAFRAIFVSEQLAHVKGLAFNLNELLARMDERVGESLTRVEHTTTEVNITTQRKLDEIRESQARFEALLANPRASDLMQHAAEHGIPEAALRTVVERLGGESLSRADLIPWLEGWIERAMRQLTKQSNEDAAFEAASDEARRRFRVGRLTEASSPLMDEFAREEKEEAARQEERKLRRLRLLEQAIRFDELAFNGEVAAQKVRLMAAVEGISGAEALGAWLHKKAGEHYERGQQKGENGALLVAIATFREALKERARERVPLEWAESQNNLGVALSVLGERMAGPERLEEAVAAYRAALTVYTPEHVPLDWAMTQNNLGNAFHALGIRESGTERLEEAVAAYRSALTERTRERVPLEWAATQNNLGNTLATIGQREAGTERLDEAVAAYRAALAEYTRKLVPLKWADTQSNLGNALAALCTLEASTERMEEAVAAYRAALEERTRKRVPLHWAETQNNLGNALMLLGNLKASAELLKEALTAYRAALEERTRERVPLDWAGTQNNIGYVLVALAAHESAKERLEEAVAAYRASLEVRTRERVPLDYASTMVRLSVALVVLGQLKSCRAKLEEALVAADGALEVFRKIKAADHVDMAESLRAQILAALSRI